MRSFTVTGPLGSSEHLSLKAAQLECCRQLLKIGSSNTQYKRAKNYNGEFTSSVFVSLDGQTVTVAKVY